MIMLNNIMLNNKILAFSDSDWIKKILQGPCIFCDSPLY